MQRRYECGRSFCALISGEAQQNFASDVTLPTTLRVDAVTNVVNGIYNATNSTLPGLFLGTAAAASRRLSAIASATFPFSTDALLTRYAGDKFERSQHAYRTQRAQIHIQVYALRERRDDPAPKHTHPATLYYLLLYYTNTHAT